LLTPETGYENAQSRSPKTNESARVRYVAGMLNIQLDVINIAYDDDKNTTDLIGTKQVPLLIKDNGEAMAESLNIIAYFLELATSSETSQPSQPVLDWQKVAFLPLQKVGYPRWSKWIEQSLPLSLHCSLGAQKRKPKHSILTHFCKTHRTLPKRSKRSSKVPKVY
jgi:glutaredoxin 2